MTSPETQAKDAVIKVLCVDDHPDIAGFLESAVNGEPGMACIGVLHRADELLAEVERTQPDVILLDLSMPGKQPLEATQEVSGRYPNVRTIVFSAYDDPASVKRAANAGAAGYLSKGMDMAAILDGIRRVARGETVAP